MNRTLPVLDRSRGLFVLTNGCAASGDEEVITNTASVENQAIGYVLTNRVKLCTKYHQLSIESE